MKDAKKAHDTLDIIWDSLTASDRLDCDAEQWFEVLREHIDATELENNRLQRKCKRLEGMLRSVDIANFIKQGAGL